MMKRVLPGIVIILSCLCLFVLSSCGTYRVENEEQSIKIYYRFIGDLGNESLREITTNELQNA